MAFEQSYRKEERDACISEREEAERTSVKALRQEGTNCVPGLHSLQAEILKCLVVYAPGSEFLAMVPTMSSLLDPACGARLLAQQVSNIDCDLRHTMVRSCQLISSPCAHWQGTGHVRWEWSDCWAWEKEKIHLCSASSLPLGGTISALMPGTRWESLIQKWSIGKPTWPQFKPLLQPGCVRNKHAILTHICLGPVSPLGREEGCCFIPLYELG